MFRFGGLVIVWLGALLLVATVAGLLLWNGCRQSAPHADQPAADSQQESRESDSGARRSADRSSSPGLPESQTGEAADQNESPAQQSGHTTFDAAAGDNTGEGAATEAGGHSGSGGGNHQSRNHTVRNRGEETASDIGDSGKEGSPPAARSTRQSAARPGAGEPAADPEQIRRAVDAAGKAAHQAQAAAKRGNYHQAYQRALEGWQAVRPHAAADEQAARWARELLGLLRAYGKHVEESSPPADDSVPLLTR